MTAHKLSMADEAVITALTAKQAELETEIEYLHNELASMRTGPHADLLKENRNLRHELAVLVHGVDVESDRLREQLVASQARIKELESELNQASVGRLEITEDGMDMETVRDLVKKLRLIAKAFAYEKVTNAQAKSTVPHLNDAIAVIEGLMQELAMLQQTSLEYCEDCGWNARVPEYGCLKCMDETRPPLDRCPQCGGEADNGHDRCYPPSAYLCSKCTETPNS